VNWFIRWFEPGIGLKRWILPIAIGTFLLGVGLFPIRHFIVPGFIREIVSWYFLLGTGLFLLVLGVIGLIYSVASRTHRGEKSLYATLKQSSRLRSGPRIVALGGGTGLSTVLRGLKNITSNLTAIVTVTDDGGSSGRLREEFDLPAPGDLRNCLVALAPEEERMSELFEYRFSEGKGLKGHSMGNLLLTALTDITGGFDAALRESSNVLATRGRVLPSMTGTPELRAIMDNGSEQAGETAISKSEQKIRELSVEPNPVSPNTEALVEISAADLIVVGPGSLYTSILANFLEPELCSAFRNSVAETFYVCNLMTEFGETDGFTVKDHIDTFRDVPPEPIQFDHILVNVRQPPTSVREQYEQENAELVRYDFDELRDYPEEFHAGDYLRIEDGVLRHDVTELCRTIQQIYQGNARQKT